jgi:hypothetical protein
MKRTGKTARAAIVATVLTLVAAGTSSARADEGDQLKGGCGFDTNSQPTLTGGQNVGVMYEASVSLHASGLPSTATVSCWIEVNGVEAPGTRTSQSGNGVQEGEATLSFTASGNDQVQLCQQVTFADGSTWVQDGNVGIDCPIA